MVTPTDLPDCLTKLGDALHAAAAADLAAAAGVSSPAAARRRRRRIVGALVAAVIAVPTVAFAAQLISPSEVASSLPRGTLALLGTHPSCTTLTAGVDYECTLGSKPSNDGGPPAGQWLGTVEPTVDASKHVNGGCRAQNADGTRWHCYLGEAAVRQQIIGQGFLGQYAPSPGVG